MGEGGCAFPDDNSPHGHLLEASASASAEAGSSSLARCYILRRGVGLRHGAVNLSKLLVFWPVNCRSCFIGKLGTRGRGYDNFFM